MNRHLHTLLPLLLALLVLMSCGDGKETPSGEGGDAGVADTGVSDSADDTDTADDDDTGVTDTPDVVEDTGQQLVDRVRDYIRSDNYDRLVLEVDYTTGVAPTESVIDDLVAGLTPLFDKPAGIEVVLDEELPPRGSDYAWSFGELAELAGLTYDLEVDEDTIKMHVLIVDGHDERDDEEGSILGLSWSNLNIVLYQESLDRLCESEAGNSLRRAGLVEEACARTQLAIWTHELGHVIGLVDMGLPMVEDHEDPEHAHHDHNEECVMYWAYARQQAFDEIGKQLLDDGDATLGFDAGCKADIAAVRER